MYDELRELNEIIKKKQLRLDELRAAAVSISIPWDQKVQSSSDDRLANLMCKIIILENEIDGLIDDFADLKAQAKQEIFTLPFDEWQDVMYLHYIEFKPMEEVAEILSRGRKEPLTVGAAYMKNNRAIKFLKKMKKSQKFS